MRSPSHGALLAGSALAWLAGVGAQLQQPALWPSATYAWLSGAGTAMIVLGWALRRRAAWRHALAALLGGLALAGFSVTALHATARLADALAPALEGRDLLVTGVVASLPQAGEAGWRFRFAVEDAVLDGQVVAVPRTIALGWYRGAHEDAALLQPASELRAGQRWRIGVRLRRPHGNANPHGFDYELYLFEQGVRATGYVRDAPPPLRLQDAAGHPVDRLRQRVRDAIAVRVADARAAGILAALAVGDQAAIARDDWALFRNAGVAHLMSISGLHVTMFAWLAGLACAWVWRRSARAMLWLPAPTSARWGGVAAAIGYAVFAGWGVPAQRTVLMLLMVTALQTLGRHWPWPLVLLAAAVAVTISDPWALLQPGFWLSFMAVGLLMSSAGAGLQEAPAAVGGRGARAWALRLWAAARGGLRTQVVAAVGLAPLTLVLFQQVSLVGFLANLVAIPVVTLLVTPLALLGTLLAPLWQLAAWITQGLVALLAWLVSWPQSVWSGAAAPPWAQGAALVAALLLVLPVPWRIRLLAVPLALPLLLPARALPAAGEFAVVAVDVGQGSAVFVRTRDHLFVYDAGPRYSRDGDAGQRVLLPLLRALGETRIDELALSHRDTDHVGGAQALVAILPPAQLRSSFDPGPELQAALPPERALRCEAGQHWTWDGVAFDVLWPPAAEYERARKPNALSCVLRVEGGGASLLLAGDIEAAQERALVAAQGAALESDVLVVPHHGSKTSSSAVFLDVVRPRLAVVQAGYRNRFGHPAEEVLERYRERGIALRMTPDCGAWQWLASDAPEESCWRPGSRRYWHHPGTSAP